MAPRYRPRHAVYLLTPAPGWRPNSPWSFPPTVTGGRLYARHVTPRDAKAAARAHNLDQLKRTYAKLAVESWAVFTPYLRPRRGGKVGAV